MIPVPSGVRVWLSVGRTDMRKGMNGLALQVQQVLGRDPHAGDPYVFRGVRGDLVKIVLVTSLDLADDRIAVVAAGPEGVWAVDTPRLPIEATGCGDAVAALFLGWLLKGKPIPGALAATIAAIYGVIEATMRSAGGELALVAAQDELVSPKRSVSLQQL